MGYVTYGEKKKYNNLKSL